MIRRRDCSVIVREAIGKSDERASSRGAYLIVNFPGLAPVDEIKIHRMCDSADKKTIKHKGHQVHEGTRSKPFCFPLPALCRRHTCVHCAHKVMCVIVSLFFRAPAGRAPV